MNIGIKVLVGINFIAFITFLVLYIKELRKGETDWLTSVFNRRYFSKRLKRYGHKNKSLGVILIDLDDFKYFNDRGGHMVGDDILIEISRILKLCVRKHDRVIRWGGDEFIILCDTLSQKDMSGLITRIQNYHTPKLKSIENLYKKPITFTTGTQVLQKCTIKTMTKTKNWEESRHWFNTIDQEMYTNKNRKKDGMRDSRFHSR